MSLFTLKMWNDMVDQVGTNLAGIPASCGGPGQQIDHHDKNKPLTKKDVQDIRDAIDAICPYDWQVDLNKAISEKLRDELYGGIANLITCCPQCKDSVITLENPTPITASLYPQCTPVCDDTDQVEVLVSAHDLVEGMQVGPPGFAGREWYIQEQRAGGSGAGNYTVAIGGVACDGTIEGASTTPTIHSSFINQFRSCPYMTEVPDPNNPGFLMGVTDCSRQVFTPNPVYTSIIIKLFVNCNGATPC